MPAAKSPDVWKMAAELKAAYPHRQVWLWLNVQSGMLSVELSRDTHTDGASFNVTLYPDGGHVLEQVERARVMWETRTTPDGRSEVPVRKPRKKPVPSPPKTVGRHDAGVRNKRAPAVR